MKAMDKIEELVLEMVRRGKTPRWMCADVWSERDLREQAEETGE